MNFPFEVPVLEAADCFSRCSPRVATCGRRAQADGRSPRSEPRAEIRLSVGQNLTPPQVPRLSSSLPLAPSRARRYSPLVGPAAEDCSRGRLELPLGRFGRAPVVLGLVCWRRRRLQAPALEELLPTRGWPSECHDIGSGGV